MIWWCVYICVWYSQFFRYAGNSASTECTEWWGCSRLFRAGSKLCRVAYWEFSVHKLYAGLGSLAPKVCFIFKHTAQSAELHTVGEAQNYCYAADAQIPIILNNWDCASRFAAPYPFLAGNQSYSSTWNMLLPISPQKNPKPKPKTKYTHPPSAFIWRNSYG